MMRLILTGALWSCFCISLSSSVHAGSQEVDNRRMRKKLKTIVIPKVQFADARVSTVIEYLKQRSRELDPQGAGVNFVLILKPAKTEPRKPKPQAATSDETFLPTAPVEPLVTLDLDAIPLGDAVRLVCMQAGLTYNVETHAVVVMDKTVTRTKMELRIFSVDPSLFKNVKDVKTYFEDKGVTFPASP